MKTSYFNRLTIKTVLLVVLSSSLSVNCSAYPSNTNKRENTTTSKDTIMRKALGDSIYTILTDSKVVYASLKQKTRDSKNDSIVNVKISKKDKYVLDFILSDPSNFVSNDTVYGHYVPNFSITFNASKCQSCVVNFDFGLCKWNICDAKGKEIARYDLPTTDVLRLANYLFPENEYFCKLLNMPRK